MNDKRVGSNDFALIIAGGEGERFWPYSTADYPKQFLSIFFDEPMIKRTHKRIGRILPDNSVFIGTSAKYRKLSLGTIDLPEHNFIFEPAKKNTFPAIAFFVYKMFKDHPNGVTAILPADHIIKNEDGFLKVMRNAFSLAYDKDRIVTIGIKPDRADTNYGYLHPSQKMDHNGFCYFEKVSFKEKPDIETAKGFVASEEYFWNSGMFIFKFKTFIDELKKISSKDHELFMEYAYNTQDIEKLFQSDITANSVDYVIMERSDKIAMLGSEFEWDDVGNWDSLFRLKDLESGNVVIAKTELYNVHHSILISENYKIKADNLENMVIIEKDKKVLISTIDGLKDIKKGLKTKKDNPMYNCKNIDLGNFVPNYLFLDLKNLKINLIGDGVLLIIPKMTK